MEAQVLTRQSQVEIIPQETQGEDGDIELGATTIDLPPHIQKSLDTVLDYYADNALMPDIKLCGKPLDIASEFVTRLTGTIPEELTHQAEDILDFMIREMARFCKSQQINHLTLRFVFNRSYQPRAA